MLCVSVTWRSQEERACSSSSMFILRHAGKIYSIGTQRLVLDDELAFYLTLYSSQQ